VFVLDSTYLPSRARADIALIRRVTDLPVSHLATTHWHMDHNNGASAYREAFPEVSLLAERNTARWLDLNQTYWSRMSVATGSQRRAAFSALEAELARGTDASGAPYSAAERAEKQSVIERRRNELAELSTLTVVVPDRVFDGELAIDFEGTPLVLHDWGHANSPHDVTLYLPEQRILFTGDIVVQAPVPYVSASFPLAWVDVLRRIESIPAMIVVPGHGPVFYDHAYTRRVRSLLEVTHARAESMAREGRTLEQIQDALTLDDVRATEPAWMTGEAGLDETWDITRRILIERVWRNMRGQY
jgi:glyoxylase-like metal-dependent hydrolase (beta-lactamase superfamily II)